MVRIPGLFSSPDKPSRTALAAVRKYRKANTPATRGSGIDAGGGNNTAKSIFYLSKQESFLSAAGYRSDRQKQILFLEDTVHDRRGLMYRLHCTFRLSGGQKKTGRS
ncbi:hypothetical protein BO223_09270 [Faecalibaculum rodentium]|uniref:Uncharacterized protein n=1 Tax=Faecalibaculum rodentium TaxID=1702221 RepID=A0A1Q9YIM9_9FIRM|nr:hypothetical protein BO223_09270 [Faecalibaculum rodentium]